MHLLFISFTYVPLSPVQEVISSDDGSTVSGTHILQNDTGLAVLLCTLIMCATYFFSWQGFVHVREKYSGEAGNRVRAVSLYLYILLKYVIEFRAKWSFPEAKYSVLFCNMLRFHEYIFPAILRRHFRQQATYSPDSCCSLSLPLFLLSIRLKQLLLYLWLILSHLCMRTSINLWFSSFSLLKVIP